MGLKKSIPKESGALTLFRRMKIRIGVGKIGGVVFSTSFKKQAAVLPQS
jgi:hypothetical protein